MPIYKQDGDGKFVQFEPTPFPDLEKRLEDWIEQNPHMLIEGEQLAVIGRQPRTTFGKILDLLAIDETGATVIIELKIGHTPREVVAQALEYAAWVDAQSKADLDAIFARYAALTGRTAKALEEIYQETFGEDGNGDSAGEEAADAQADESIVTYNNRQRIVIVAERITDEVEQTLRYLRTRLGADVYGIEFTVHVAGGETLINTTTVVGREGQQKAVAKTEGKQEDPADTKAKVAEDFLREALDTLDDWIGDLHGFTVKRAPRGSSRKVLRGNRRVAYYYYAANWMYAILSWISPDELKALQNELADPSTLTPRKGDLHYRFHVTTPQDLALFKRLLKARSTAGAQTK